MEIHSRRIDMVAVGSSSAAVATLTADYVRRLGRYVQFSEHEVKAEAIQRGEAAVLDQEGRRITQTLDRLCQPDTTLMICDSGGEQVSSFELAEWCVAQAHLCVVIGGALGLHPDVSRRADRTVAFGKITLPHQLARLICVEQLYRSFRIARREPYHY